MIFSLLIPLMTTPPPADMPSKLATHGELRLLGSLPPDFVVDTLGNRVGQEFVLDSRLRVGVEWHPGSNWKIELQGDGFSGQVLGDPWDLAGTEDARHRERMGVVQPESFIPRVASVSGLIGGAHLEAGLVSSHWGLGMVSNDGAHDGLFGREDMGDRPIRVKLATQPLGRSGESLPLFLAVAVDQIVQDDMADRALNQSARQILGSVLTVTPAGGRVGLLAVNRLQVEPDESFTRARFIDLYAEQPFQIGDWTLQLATEIARITGTTTRLQSYNSRLGMWVGSLGAVGELALTSPDERFTAHLRTGYASADADPDDGFTQEFRFDPNYNVGMVLFDELMGAVEVGTYNRITDPAISGEPPNGIDAHVTEGSVRGAIYLQPVLEVHPLPWLEARLGGVFAWNTSPVREPFNSYRNGGVPTNHLGEPTEGYHLGTELDWALEFGDPEQNLSPLRLNPQLILQGGHLQASSDMGGETLHLLMATGRVRW
jgi:hypothetical protein